MCESFSDFWSVMGQQQGKPGGNQPLSAPSLYPGTAAGPGAGLPLPPGQVMAEPSGSRPMSRIKGLKPRQVPRSPGPGGGSGYVSSLVGGSAAASPQLQHHNMAFFAEQQGRLELIKYVTQLKYVIGYHTQYPLYCHSLDWRILDLG